MECLWLKTKHVKKPVLVGATKESEKAAKLELLGPNVMLFPAKVSTRHNFRRYNEWHRDKEWTQ